MSIQEEIAQGIDKALDAWQGDESEPQFVAAAIMPLVRKAQAEAWSAGWDASERFGYPIDDEDSFENPHREGRS